MSFIVSNAVWERSKQKSGALTVLLKLADYADDEGISWPSVSTLAKCARMSERHVQRCLEKIRRDGELEVIRNGGRRGSNLYKVCLSLVKAKQGDPSVIPDKPVGREVTRPASTSDISVTQSVIDPSKEPSSTPIVPKGDEDDLKFWIEICFKCFREAPRPVRNRILRILKNCIHRLDRGSSTLLLRFYRQSFDDKFPFFISRVHSQERLMLRLESQLALAVRVYRS
jgi:hypothetical protein